MVMADYFDRDRGRRRYRRGFGRRVKFLFYRSSFFLLLSCSILNTRNSVKRIVGLKLFWIKFCVRLYSKKKLRCVEQLLSERFGYEKDGGGEFK